MTSTCKTEVHTWRRYAIANPLAEGETPFDLDLILKHEEEDSETFPYHCGTHLKAFYSLDKLREHVRKHAA